MQITFLGTGANGGCPQIDCTCKTCLHAKEDQSEVRLRSCLLVQTDQTNIILDCGPDFRQQLLNSKLKLQDIDLVALTHLHFDHANGLMELSAGKALEVPVLVSDKNRQKLLERADINYLISSKFIKLVSQKEAKRKGVELAEVPHDPLFPTDAVVVSTKDKSIWYSPDVCEITQDMIDKMKKTNIVVFDATFLNESKYPARKLHHLPIEDSAVLLAENNIHVVFSHTNHSECCSSIESTLTPFGFALAHDGLVINI